ncbi:hypothetical protein ACFV8T_31055 [Streptomyces sp. NPDC059832]|uniref:hypothetical protein n=1 Tax=unclassified Streptomyces TaxID=2593676 RepID=UPI0036613226
MSVGEPWAADKAIRLHPGGFGQEYIGGVYRLETFGSAREARANLQGHLDRGGAGDRRSQCSALLRYGGRDGELVMWHMGPLRMWLIFEVPPGVTPLDAGVSAFKQWQPPAFRAFQAAWEEYERGESGFWFPGSIAGVDRGGYGPSPEGAGSGGGCLAAVFMVVVLLSIAAGQVGAGTL